MIVRIWHGRTTKENSERYAEFLKTKAEPDYQSIDGLQGLTFLKRDEGEITHFLLITYWDSLEAIKRFAGNDYELYFKS